MAKIKLNSPPNHSIYIYRGPGTSLVAVKHTEHTLKKLVSPIYTIQPIGPEEVIKGNWAKYATLFIMPGGVDAPYCQSLKQKGNQQILSFVQKGGAYLGFCAGAYYASKRVVFAKGTNLEETTDRELSFYPDTAEGPTLKLWDNKSNAGAKAALLEWEGPQSSFSKDHVFTVYYNGGGHFVNAEAYPQVTTLARYCTTLPKKTAIVEIAVRKGRVILSGIHCEFDPELFDMSDPFLIPIQKELAPKDQERYALMAHLLNRLGIETLPI